MTAISLVSQTQIKNNAVLQQHNSVRKDLKDILSQTAIDEATPLL